ncbi:hypothetical protein OG21DRAFT_1066808 [Imleria badia]|nr:hypothetical protein OG21DRAFT_1066808 [Imleria badia]
MTSPRIQTSVPRMISSTVLYLQQIAFCQVAGAAALFYDYLLAFGSEIDLIWARKWNLVTLLYGIVRYLSFFLILDNIFDMVNLIWTPNVSRAWYQIRMWGPYVFRIAMDILMMKRIYALSQRPNGFLSSPKWVLATMVTAFIAKVVSSITLLLLDIGPGSQVTFVESNFSGTRVCDTMMSRGNLLIASQFPTLAFEVLLFVLALTYFFADVWGFWRSRESNKWKAGDLVQILVRDSMVYFAINVAATALDIGNSNTQVPTVYIPISLALQSFLPYCFAPRLVINVKQHENRVHMSGFGEELGDMVFEEGRLPQGIQKMDHFA